MSKWRETIGEGFGTGKNKGKTREVPVTDERDGTIGGKHIEHWDGRQDAVVTPKPTKAGTRVQGADD